MMDSTNKGICPQCGAQGTAGRFCEYCGTKIPELVIEDSQKDDNTPFSWFNVIPVGYQISEEDVIGDPQKSLFMVVKAGEMRQYVQTEHVQDFGNYGHTEIRTHDKACYQYGVIGRNGKFIVDCNKERIELYAETGFCITCTKITSVIREEKFLNLTTGETLFETKGPSMGRNIASIYGTQIVKIDDYPNKTFYMFDVQNSSSIQLPDDMATRTSSGVYDTLCYCKDGILDISRTEKIGQDQKINKQWSARYENGKIQILDGKIENKVSASNSGCFGVILLAIAIPLSLLYFL